MTRKISLFIALVMGISVFATELQQVRVYQRSNGGFVAVDAGGEIVGFSSTASFRDIPESMQSLLNVQGMEAMLTDEPMPSEIAEALADYVIKDSVGPIMDVHYNQGAPYNRHLPKVGDEYCVTGCVATAMVQVMVHHHFPLKCKGGVKSYKSEDLSFSLSFDYDNYAPDWDNIITNYETLSYYTEEQAEAIAELMKAAGVSVEMNYNISKEGGSGTQTEKAADALRTYFGYDQDMMYVNKGGVESEWNKMMQDEIKANRPMICSSRPTSGGGGHAYVCDGYLTYEGMEDYPMYHFNWGWGGTDDGWFRLNKMNPAFQDLTGSFSVIKGIKPSSLTALETLRADKKMVIYDILGRVVEFTQPGQMYIRDGKKFIAK